MPPALRPVAGLGVGLGALRSIISTSLIFDPHPPLDPSRIHGSLSRQSQSPRAMNQNAMSRMTFTRSHEVVYDAGNVMKRIVPTHLPLLYKGDWYLRATNRMPRLPGAS
jgi:hypothetical protein